MKRRRRRRKKKKKKKKKKNSRRRRKMMMKMTKKRRTRKTRKTANLLRAGLWPCFSQILGHIRSIRRRQRPHLEIVRRPPVVVPWRGSSCGWRPKVAWWTWCGDCWTRARPRMSTGAGLPG